MTQATGANTALNIYEETTFAIDPGTPDARKAYYSKSGLQKKQALVDSNVLSTSRSRVRAALGNVDVTGSIETEISGEDLGILFKHLFGTQTNSGAGPYTHEYTISALPTGLCIEPDYGSAISGTGRYMKYQGCKINKGTFTFPTSGFCTASFDFVGAKATPTSAPLDATATDYGHTGFSSFSATIKEGGSTIATVKSATITLDNGLDTNAYVIGGGGQRGALPDGFATASGSIVCVFADTTMMNKALNNTSSSLEIILSRGDGLGSTGNEYISFLVENLVYDATTPSIDGPGGIDITLPFKAFKVSTQLGFKVTVKNAVATY